MEKIKKNLKESSVLVIIFMALAAVKTIINLINGMPEEGAKLPEGITPELAKVAVIVTGVISLLLLIPGVYAGIKGIKLANGAELEGNAHIVWAKVLLVLYVISAISAIASVSSTAILSGVLAICSAVLDVLAFALYIKAATAFKKESGSNN